MLRAELDRSFGDFRLQLTLEVARGATLALVGESGAGKTTVLRLLAGLDHPDRGAITVDGDTWFGGERATSRPAWQRGIGYVPQDYVLFPHLDVFENVAFGLRRQDLPRESVRSRAQAALDRLEIGALSPRRPHHLSGGQRQRVALARALALEPQVLLLDEPLSALDVQNRRALRGELRRLLSELRCATVYVTHAPLEALALGDRILVIEQGRATQDGTRDDLLRHPKTNYVAEFVGVNLFRGMPGARDGSGLVEVRTGDSTLSVVDPGGDDEVFAAVGPRDVTLHLEAPSGSARNLFHGPIEEIVPEPPHGERVRVVIASRPPLVAEISRSAAESMRLAPGRAVHATFKATAVMTYR